MYRISCFLVMVLVLGIVQSASAWDDFMVITTDFATVGSVALAERWSPWTAMVDLETIGSDAVGRWHDGRYYVVDRGGSNLQILDEDLQTLTQFSVGVSRNPQDVAFDDEGMAYVSCYDEAVLLKIDPANGTVLDSWSTAEFADADGNPETAWLARVGQQLVVTCQRLDRDNWWQPADVSFLLFFDLPSQQWLDLEPATPGVQALVLAGANPYLRLEPLGDNLRIRVGTSGRYGVLDGGLETVDVLAGTTSGFQVTENQLGGDLLDFVTVSSDLAFAIVIDNLFVTHLVTFDPRDGSGLTTIVSATGYDYLDLAYDGGDQVYLCDRTVGAAGVRVFDAAIGTELTTAPIGTGRPPFMAVVPVDETTAVGAPEPAARLAGLGLPHPNPAVPQTDIAFRLPAGSSGRLNVLDLRGRRVRSVEIQGDAAGAGSWCWDGCDARGREAAAGHYRFVLESAAGRVMRPVVLVR